MQTKSRSPKPIQSNEQVLSQFKTGTEWKPGKPGPRVTHRTKHKVVQPNDMVKEKVSEILVDWFKHEQPPADDIKVVKNSLVLVDLPHNIWRASILTTLHLPSIGARQHVSNVRFRLLHVKDTINPAKDRFSIYHNHVIFL